MPDPSPAARAMAQAFDDRYELCGPLEDDWHEKCLAAALRVLADHVVPASIESYGIRHRILAIATELDDEPDD